MWLGRAKKKKKREKKNHLGRSVKKTKSEENPRIVYENIELIVTRAGKQRGRRLKKKKKKKQGKQGEVIGCPQGRVLKLWGFEWGRGRRPKTRLEVKKRNWW